MAWKHICKLEDCLDALIDYRGKTPRKTDFGIPLITAKVVKSGHIGKLDEFIPEEYYETWMKRGYPEIGDVVLTTEAPLGEVAQIKFLPVALAQRIVTLRGKQGVLDSGYLLYLMQSQEMQEKLLSRSSGTTVIGIKQSELRKIEVALPSVSEQRAIAHILGTLDDKIELNRRQSETLQEMARALFKAWFVDFEPVRAKMSGRWQRGQTLPGLPAHLWNLFPDRLVETEHGEVPQGWETVLLGDFIETVKGRSYKSTELAPSTTALVTLKSFARGGGYRADGLKSYTGAYKPEQVVEPGEVVISCTDVTQAAEVIGRAVIVRRSQQYHTLVASLDTAIVRPRSERITRMFLYHLGRSERFVAHTCSHVTGTTVLHLGKNAIPSFQFPLPPQNIVHHFDEIAAGMFARITTLEHEEEYLAALRDTLLPQLLSGALRVPDAEKFLQERGL